MSKSDILEYFSSIFNIEYGNILNNDPRNLRFVDYRDNSNNRHKSRSDSVSGLLGVSKYGNGKKWRVRFGNNKRHLGVFNSPIEAVEIYWANKFLIYPDMKKHWINLYLEQLKLANEIESSKKEKHVNR